MENLKFQDFNLSKDLFKAVQGMGFEVATPIQSQAIPVVLDGRDVSLHKQFVKMVKESKN